MSTRGNRPTADFLIGWDEKHELGNPEGAPFEIRMDAELIDRITDPDRHRGFRILQP